MTRTARANDRAQGWQYPAASGQSRFNKHLGEISAYQLDQAKLKAEKDKHEASATRYPGHRLLCRRLVLGGQREAQWDLRNTGECSLKA